MFGRAQRIRLCKLKILLQVLSPHLSNPPHLRPSNQFETLQAKNLCISKLFVPEFMHHVAYLRQNSTAVSSFSPISIDYLHSPDQWKLQHFGRITLCIGIYWFRSSWRILWICHTAGRIAAEYYKSLILCTFVRKKFSSRFPPSALGTHHRSEYMHCILFCIWILHS